MSAASTVPLLFSPHSLVDPERRGRSVRRSKDRKANTALIRKVLACVDGSDLGGGIVPHARAVARDLGAGLTLLRVLETEFLGSAPPDPLDWEIRQREAQGQLRSLANGVRDPESEIRWELIQGRAAEQICSWAEQHDIDLTVICSHGARGLTDWDLASTARKLIDRIPGSVLLVPAAAAAMSGDVHYKRILVPLDGSARAESVVPIAMRIAAAHDAEVLFVHIVPAPGLTRTGPLDEEGAELERRVRRHNQRVASDYLNRLRARASHAGARVQALVVADGSVRTRLERLVREERADLVVMSAHGHTGATESSCGGVTEYAATHAAVPLLIVRERLPVRTHRVDADRPSPRERLLPTEHATS